MPNLNINTGVIKLTINDDPKRIVTFNPADVTFAEKFEELIRNLEAKQTEYQQRAQDLDSDQTTDANGLPINLKARIAFMRESCEFMHAQIDQVFGAGTSQTVFEGALGLEMISQFFEGLTPYVQTARSEKTQKYSRKQGKRALK